MTRLALSLVIVTLLAAMSRAPETPCGAELHEDLVGREWSDTLLPERDGPVRVLRPRSVATMDHRPERLNIHLDDADRVSQLRCG